MLDDAPPIGHNGGPPLDEERVGALTSEHVRLVRVALTIICTICDEADQAAPLERLKPFAGRTRPQMIRRMLFVALEGHMPVWALARIAGCDRRTISRERNVAALQANENGLIRETLEMLRDLVEPLPALLDNAGETIEDMLFSDVACSGLVRKRDPSTRAPAVVQPAAVKDAAAGLSEEARSYIDRLYAATTKGRVSS